MLFVDFFRITRSPGVLVTRSATVTPADDVPPARGAGACRRRYRPPVTRSRYDVVVVGGGHNGLVAAAYLAPGRAVGAGPRARGPGRRRGGQPAGVRRRRRPAVRLLLPGQPAARPDRRRPRPGGPAGRPRRRLLHGDHARRPLRPDCWSSATRAPPPRRPSGSSPAPTTSSPAGSASTAGWPPSPRTSRPPSPSRCCPPTTLAGRLRDPELWHDLRDRPLADVVADHLSDDVVRGDGPDRRADRDVRRRPRGRRARRALLPLPPGRQRDRPLAGARRRHGRGHRRDGRRRPPRRRGARHAGHGHRPGPAAGRRHGALDRRGRRRTGRRRRPRRLRRRPERAGRAHRRGRGPARRRARS